MTRANPHPDPGFACIVASDGRPGHENQALALAEAAGVVPDILRSAPRPGIAALPPAVLSRLPGAAICGLLGVPLRPASGRPALVIGCGRRTAPVIAAWKRADPDRVFAVQVQSPQMRPEAFDLVIAPAHDGPAPPNGIATAGALTPIAPERLAAEPPDPRIEALPAPRLAVLIGGPSKVHRFSVANAERLAAQLAAHAADGWSIMATASRRTGPEATAALVAAVSGPRRFLWDGSGANPYRAMLAAADAVLVTEDSVGMVTDACASGKPVAVIPMAGGAPKFRRFLDGLEAEGRIGRYDGNLEAARAAGGGLRDTAEAGARVRAAADAHLVGR